MDQTKIRNFSIIAHIDHGKSTLADRMLELTGTIERRKMKEQVLDSMELERERGITIKMQPVRMKFAYNHQDYHLNLIDTPGHIDFSYEVSRALKAVEGVVLLVDATQGIQAQTFSVLNLAQELKLKIIPVINKIDLPSARPDEIRRELAILVNCAESEVLAVSGKTGQGVQELLQAIVTRLPAPRSELSQLSGNRSLVFDFQYSNHRGVVVFVRVFDGKISPGDQLHFLVSGVKFIASEVGYFSPDYLPRPELTAGEIGYVVTGVKSSGQVKVGDTLCHWRQTPTAIAGYQEPKPVVWASIYPESQNDFSVLKQALERLRLEDASLSYEEESSGSLGRGFRAGFLGMLHLEIISERLKREFSLALVVTTPSISYLVQDEKSGQIEEIYSPHLFPQETKGKQVFETWAKIKLMMPLDYLNAVMPLLHDHEAVILATENFGAHRANLIIEMPLRELMRNFFDELKSATSGFASLSYELLSPRPAEVVRLDILLNGDIIPAFSRVVARKRLDREAEEAVDRLRGLLPRQLIIIKIQAQGAGRIIAARTLSALKKDVTGYLYGGDISRKKKLWEKQKKGKKKMQVIGKVNVPHDVFLKMMRTGN